MPISPLSKVQTLGKTGAIPKDQSKRGKERRSDGQHTSVDNCGCHSCIFKLAIIKNEIIRPDRKFSRRFLESVKNLRINHHTSLTSHPQDCICKMHIEKMNYKMKPTPPKSQQSYPRPDYTSVASSNVSSLRSHYEEKEKKGKRLDPRTGHPPTSQKTTNNLNSSGEKRKESSTSQSSVPVLTSR